MADGDDVKQRLLLEVQEAAENATAVGSESTRDGEELAPEVGSAEGSWPAVINGDGGDDGGDDGQHGGSGVQVDGEEATQALDMDLDSSLRRRRRGRGFRAEFTEERSSTNGGEDGDVCIVVLGKKRKRPETIEIELVNDGEEHERHVKKRYRVEERKEVYGGPAAAADKAQTDPTVVLYPRVNASSLTDEQIRRANDHLKQNLDLISRHELTELQRVLLHDAERKQYYPRRRELRTTNYWPQRSAMLAAIEFLTEYGELSDTVVYAVAGATSAQVEYLAQCFTKHTFVVFSPRVEAGASLNGRVDVRTDAFSSAHARQFRGKDWLLIADMHEEPREGLSGEEIEDIVEEYQRNQMEWHVLMRPVSSMLRFRLPWGKGTTRYLNGRIFLPLWGRSSTTESRLVVDQRNLETHTYDHTKYEEQMFYFNTVTRVSYYEHMVHDVPGLCHCYDCAGEVLVLANFLKKCHDVGEEELWARVRHKSLELNYCCSHARRVRTLEMLNGKKGVPVGRGWMGLRRYDEDSGTITLLGSRERERIMAKRVGLDSCLRKPRTCLNEMDVEVEETEPAEVIELEDGQDAEDGGKESDGGIEEVFQSD